MKKILIISGILISFCGYSQKSIPQLTTKATPVGTDWTHIVRSNVDYKISSGNMVLGMPLTGYTSGAGTISATDNVLQAFQKLNGNIVAIPSAWFLSGNSGTTAANFIGTTDSRSLRFRTNNAQRFIIDSAAAKVGVGVLSSALLNVNATISSPEHIRLNGQDYGAYDSQASGLSLLLGVNTGGNKQLWIGNSDNLAKNATNTVLAITVSGTGSPSFDAFSTDVSTIKNIVMQTSGANVGIGATTPTAKLHVISTTEQLRIGYDVSNYNTTTVGPTGLTTMNAVGSEAGFKFLDPINPFTDTTHVAGSITGYATGNEPFAGITYKKVIINCISLNGTATYTFPTAFLYIPIQSAGPALVTALSTTAITVTGTTSTAFITLEGY